MADITFDGLLHDRSSDLALIIGNGINRYIESDTVNSWDRLLIDIAHEYMPDIKAIPKGIALTEFYDVLELKSGAPTSELQGKFRDLLLTSRQYRPHSAL